MAYVRKTKDTFVIQSNYGYGHGWEDTCEYDERIEARDDLKAYRENQPEFPHRLITRRERL